MYQFIYKKLFDKNPYLEQFTIKFLDKNPNFERFFSDSSNIFIHQSLSVTDKIISVV